MLVQNAKYNLRSAMTLLESVIALSIVSIVFAVILPQFRNIYAAWDSRISNGETLQNARVLTEHINRNIQKAVKIVAVSNSSDSTGYIEFEDADGNTMRYDVAGDNYIQFGPAGNLATLAGPVSQLQFACYALDDLTSPITDADSIRYITAEVTLTNPSAASSDKACTTAVYLRVNDDVALPPTTSDTTYDYSNRTQDTNIFAYSGEDNQKVPLDSSSPSSVLNPSQYDDIENDDNTFHLYSVLSLSKYAQVRYVINIDENENEVTQIIATWSGKGINTGYASGVSLYIWNYASSDYELLQASADTDAVVTLVGTLTDSLADYIGGASSDTVTLFAVSNSKMKNKKTNKLYTDYVKLRVTAGSGGGSMLP